MIELREVSLAWDSLRGGLLQCMLLQAVCEPLAQNHGPKDIVSLYVKPNFSIWFLMESHLRSSSSDVTITLRGI